MSGGSLYSLFDPLCVKMTAKTCNISKKNYSTLDISFDWDICRYDRIKQENIVAGGYTEF